MMLSSSATLPTRSRSTASSRSGALGGHPRFREVAELIVREAEQVESLGHLLRLVRDESVEALDRTRVVLGFDQRRGIVDGDVRRQLDQRDARLRFLCVRSRNGNP